MSFTYASFQKNLKKNNKTLRKKLFKGNRVVFDDPRSESVFFEVYDKGTGYLIASGGYRYDELGVPLNYFLHQQQNASADGRTLDFWSTNFTIQSQDPFLKEGSRKSFKKHVKGFSNMMGTRAFQEIFEYSVFSGNCDPLAEYLDQLPGIYLESGVGSSTGVKTANALSYSYA